MNQFTTDNLPVRASVVIVSCNSRKHLEYGFPDIVASLGENDELILVDNASTDGSAEWVRGKFPSVRLIVPESNLGFGGANNLAAGHARGEFVVFINPDTVVQSSWLEALLQALQADSREKLVTSRIVLMSDPGRINARGNNVHLSGITLCRGMGRAKDEFSTPAVVNAVSGAAFAMHRTLFQQLGGFDADFHLYMEDTDLSLRARLAGVCCIFVPGSIVQHAYELRLGSNKTFYQERNRYLMLLKFYKWGTLLVLIPVFLLSEVVTWGYVFLREPARVGNKLRAYGWVFRNWGQILSSRRRTQRLRRVPDRLLITEMGSHLAINQVEPGWLGNIATPILLAIFTMLKLWSKFWIWW
jgi:GT2 family glycosyltransferase